MIELAILGIVFTVLLLYGVPVSFCIGIATLLGIDVARSFFPVRCDDPLTYVELVRAGCGVGGILRAVGDPDPMLERIDLIPDLPSLPVWLTAAPNLRQSPRLRRVWDALAAAFPA